MPAERCAECPLPATHHVIGLRRPVRWGLFLALPGEQATHCLRHGADVMEERNHVRKEASHAR